MKKIFLASLFLLALLSGNIEASFDSTFTQVSGDTTFIKESGQNELRVSEDYFINPFGSSVIKENKTICTGNNCPCGSSGCEYTTGYTVDGELFNTSHSKFKPANATRRSWYSYEDGIDSSVTYLQNTYIQENGVYKPRQTVKVRRYYITTYQHDTSTPTCGEVNYYNDEALSENFTYDGGWLNTPKYFTMTCLDSETGCYCAPDDESCEIKDGKVISTPQLLGHNINPSVSFTNSVKLTDVSCAPGGTFQKVLFDLKNPQFDITVGGESFNINQESLRVYDEVSGKKLDGIEVPGKLSFTRTGSINQLVGNTNIDLDIEDAFLSGSVHGVSGLKDYNFKILRQTDSSFRVIPEQELTSCTQDEVISASFNPDGSIESTDSRNLNFSCPDLEQAGKYDFVFTSHDWAGNEIVAKTQVNLYPSNISLSQSSLIVSSSNDKYANNIDEYDYELHLKDNYGNPIFNTIIEDPIQSIQDYTGGREILLGNNNTPLIYSYPSSTTDIDGVYRFSVKSLLPGTYTERFILAYNSWDENFTQTGPYQSTYITNNSTNFYNKPFSANLVFIGPGDNPELGTEHDYRIDISNDGGINAYSNSTLDINASSLNFSSHHRFDDLGAIDNTFNSGDLSCSFTGNFNATTPTGVLETPIIDINSMEVRYRVGGENIVYPLDSFGISGCAVSTIGLKTIGTVQGDGKGEISGGSENFSDISTGLLRSQIRQNAYELIRGMSSGDIINGVRYIEGDATISGNLSYETLIVKNGNIIISGDLNNAGNTLGLISLKDSGFNINTDYDNIGNIYVLNNVENISANIYADGTFRSANSSGVEYNDSALGNKLVLKGTLFTRNTVGGGLTAGSDYILPGGTSTTNRELASIYDLNYIRRAQTCGEVDDYSFLIEYNPEIQSNPPKGFNTN